MKLRPDWASIALAEYSGGASDSEVTSALQITQGEFANYCAEDENFATVVEYGREMAKAFWYRQARQNLNNPKFQTTLWYAVMKNRYGWAEKTASTSDIPVSEKSDDELRAELREKLKKFEKLDNVRPIKKSAS